MGFKPVASWRSLIEIYAGTFRIDLIAWFCNTCNLSICTLAELIRHILEYSIIERTIVLYKLTMRLGLFLSDIPDRALIRFILLYALEIIFLVWGSHVNLESNVTPKKSALVHIGISWLNNFKLIFSFLRRGHLLKMTTFDLSGFSVTLHFLHHSSRFKRHFCKFVAAVCSDFSVAQSPMSSAYCDAKFFHSLALLVCHWQKLSIVLERDKNLVVCLHLKTPNLIGIHWQTPSTTCHQEKKTVNFPFDLSDQYF